MANPSKDKAKANPGPTRKPATHGGKTPNSGAKAKPIDSGQKYVVSGLVTYADSTPAAGLTVIAYGAAKFRRSKKDNRVADIVRTNDENTGTSGNPLGHEAMTDAEGRYVIEFLKNEAAGNTGAQRSGLNIFVRVFDGGNRMGESDVLLASSTKIQIDLHLNYANTPWRRVSGEVRNEYGELLDNVNVEAFDCSFRREHHLGSDITKEGQYEIRYKQSQLCKAEKDTADLVMKVFSAGEKEPHKTLIRYNVPHEAEVNIGLKGVEYKGPSEFEVLTNKLMPLLEGTSPLDLREDDKFQDISFLVGEMGRTQVEISIWILCHRMADKAMREKTPVEPGVFFGFLRQGQPALNYKALLDEAQTPERVAMFEEKALRELASISSELQLSLLEQAFSDNLIPGCLKRGLEETLEVLRQIKLRFAADNTYAAGKGTIRQLLELTPEAGKAQSAFMTAFADHNGPINEFWEKIKKEKVLGPETVEDIKLSFEIAALTRSHIPLVGELKKRFQSGDIKAKRDLARYSREDWKDVFKRPGSDGKPIGVPANIDGDDNEERLEQFAFIVERGFERSYPTTSFASKLARTERRLVASKADVVRFVENNPNFHLDRYRVDHYVAENENALEGVENKAALVTDLKSIQRVFKLDPTYRTVEALLTRNIDSSQQIYFMGPEQFLTKIAGSGINKFEAKRLCQKAEGTYAGTLALFGELNIALNGVIPYGVATYPSDEETRSKIAALPNLQTLFGSLDYCECIHCRSVYGPAAYFVDVMHFLGKRETQGIAINTGKNVQEVLLKRRPDLGEIELSCENTNTPLPYIDLVNEILEDVVAPPTPVTLAAVEADLIAGPIKITVLKDLTTKSVAIDTDAQIYAPDSRGQWAIRGQHYAYKVSKSGTKLHLLPTRQTFLSAAELRANPEYTNQDAYIKLSEEVFPFNLPFDLWNLQVRTYLNHLSVPQPRLFELLQQKLADDKTLTPSDLQIDCAWLGVTESERKILTGTFKGKRSWDFWGLAQTTNNILNPENPLEVITGSWTKVLSNVNVILNRSGLTYKELLQLLDMKYVNPEKYVNSDRSVSIFDSADPNAANCDTSTFTISNLTQDTLDRMHCFIRLWRKLGCAMWELDMLLPDIDKASNVIDKRITDDVLQTISRMNRLRLLTKLDWRVVYSLYNGIDHNLYMDRSKDGTPAVQTIYQRLFRNKLVDAIAIFPPQPEQITGAIADKVPGILAAFRIKEADLKLILDGLSLATTANLDATVLSHIYRITVLAQALVLSVDTFLRLKGLWAQDPFENPGATLKFAELAQKIGASGFSVLELDYLLAHRFTPSSGVALEDKTIVATLKALREGLKKINDDVRLKTEETKDAYVKSKLGLLPALEKDKHQVIALSIIDGTWRGPAAERNSFINKFFQFFANLATARTNLGVIISPTLSAADKQNEVDKRFEYVQPDLEAFLLKAQKEDFICQTTADLLKLDAQSAKSLLTGLHLQGAAADTLLQIISDKRLLDEQLTLDDQNFLKVFESLRLLHKVAIVIGKLHMRAEEVAWWLAGNHAKDMGWMHPVDLPIVSTNPVDIEQWVAMQQFFAWKDELPKSDLTAFEFASGVLDNTKLSTVNVDELAKLTNWDATGINDLARAFHWVDPAAKLDVIKQELRKSTNLVRLADVMRALRRLGVNAARAIEWAKTNVHSADAESLKRTVKSKYDLTQWQQAIRPIHDEFREQKRQALVGWLVTHPDPAQGQNWSDTNGMYGYFLIDVEMGACMLTSRLKQAAASAQLFVQRCLLNIEVDILANTDMDSKWKQWKWMKYYRVWEANRKVFLYPENWIEPELRDEKSPFFEDLESELMQNDVTNDIAEQAYLNYLEKLDKVANLEIRAMYNQVSQDGSALHVFGRTRSSLAPEYYYRKRINGGRWVAWQKVELEINANLLAPSVFNNRLYLFWPQFIEKANMPKTLSTPQLGQSSTPIQEPDKYWEVRLFWSELKNGKWTPKVLSDKFAILRRQNEETYQDLALRLTNAPNMVVQLFDSGSARQLAPGNRFDFNVIGKQIDVLSREWTKSPPSVVSNAGFEERTEESFLDTLCLVVAPKSQVRDGLIMNYDKNVSYNSSLRLSTSTKSVVTKTTKPPLPPPPRSFLSGSRLYAVSASNSGPFSTGESIEKDSEIYATASGTLKFRQDVDAGHSGPEGDNGAVGTQYPLETAPRYALLARIGTKYYKIGKEATFTADSEGPLALLFNEFETASDNTGTANVAITVKRPDPKVPAPFQPVVTVEEHASPFNPPATDSMNSVLLMQAGIPDSFIVVDSYNRSFDPKADDQFFYWDKSRTYFVDYQGSTKAGSAYDPYAPEQYISSFRFFIHYHPFVELFTKQLNIRGLKGLLNRKIQVEPANISGSPVLFDFNDYQPIDVVVKNYPLPDKTLSYPVEDVDFSYEGAYSPYNWELFFHVPFFIANKLSANQRFEEALEWFHYIFDATSTDNTVANPDTPQQKFWITKPFYETTKADYYKQKIENIMLAIAKKEPAFTAQVEEWRENPFNPHLIARMRTVAYQKNVLIKYIGNLIAWGDQLFRRDTIETINEATQLYIMAASILGPRPKSIPKSIPNPVKTFYQLDEDGIDDFGNVLKQVENLLPVVSSSGTGDTRDDDRPEMPRLDVLYFCIPHNEKLLTLWDTVADRLFKIRHCMNIEGIVRQLPLFEPPIEPAFLVKAAAAGLDIGAVLNDMNAPMPLYRFTFMIQRALEICSEVKSLGGAMLAALEKRDAEAFTLLRSNHERMMLDQVRFIKNSQVNEALRAKEAMDESKKITEEKKNYHQKLISDGWSAGESTAFGLSTAATVLNAAIAIGYGLAGGLKLVPSFLAGGAGVGGTPTVHATFGGKEIGGSAEMAVSTLQSIAAAFDKGASLASTVASYERRSAEWEFQKRVAEKEIAQMDKQIAAADIRHQIATQDLVNQDKQIENAQKEDEYMRAKFTNQELYDWMISQISTVYFQSYQLAYDIAKRAERCFRYEQGLSDSSYIQFGYWDSLKKGLLSGDKLYYDLKRLETSYYEQNRREYELTKHISLTQLDPIALLKLRQNGECFVDIPETVFDMDYPGHYFRRVKTVGLSIPCVTGPYTTVACTLTLTSNHLRKDSTLLGGKYERDLTNGDLRFRDEIAAIQSIATSNAQNDDGMFELNFRDERYLPCEGAGAISSWHIKLNKDLPQFDFSTISDVIIHLNYTAREGGGLLRSKVVEELGSKLSDMALAENRQGLFRVFDVKREFSAKWHKFLHPASTADDQELLLDDLPDRLPYFTRRFKTKEVHKIEVVAQMKSPASIYKVMLSPLGNTDADLLSLESDTTYLGLHRALKDLTGSEINFSAWKLKIKLDGVADFKSLPADAIEELFLIVNYKIKIA